ncbi:MAG: hypothetical protein ABI876_14145 [Bacteroidota bacterium]
MAGYLQDRAHFAFNKDMLSEAAFAVAGGVAYTIIPTAIGKNGAWGMGIGLGSVLALGFLLKSKALLLGGLMVAVTHLIYKYGSNYTVQWWGRPVWSLDETNAPAAGQMNDYVHGPVAMNDYMQMPNGYSALSLPPGDAPSHQMNDYVMPNDHSLMDGDDDSDFMYNNRYEQNGGSYDAKSMFE